MNREKWLNNLNPEEKEKYLQFELNDAKGRRLSLNGVYIVSAAIVTMSTPLFAAGRYREGAMVAVGGLGIGFANHFGFIPANETQIKQISQQISELSSKQFTGADSSPLEATQPTRSLVSQSANDPQLAKTRPHVPVARSINK
jgi:hypothetical protein